MGEGQYWRLGEWREGGGGGEWGVYNAAWGIGEGEGEGQYCRTGGMERGGEYYDAGK
jgi:hypothetical protein